MPPKAQPRRRQPARGGQSATHEGQPDKTLGTPSAKEAISEPHNESQTLLANEQTDVELDSHMSDGHPTPIAMNESSPPRQPVQRLASVLSRAPQDALSNTYGDTRPSSLKFRPKSFIRRSKEERDAVEKAEAERHAARQAMEGGASRNIRGGFSAAARGRGSSSGETNRWKNERFNLSHGASGHLGGSTLPEVSASKRGRGRGGGGGRSGGGGRGGRSGPSDIAGTSSSTRLKNEPAIKPEKDKDGDTVMTSSTSNSKAKRTKVKNEDQALNYVSSEGELDSDGAARVDIEQINLVSDDEETEGEMPATSEVAKGKRHQKAQQVRHDPLRPIRIQRQEHVERAVGVNTDASSLTSAELRRKAKERNEADGSLFLPDNNEQEISRTSEAKARRKPRDVEFVRDERKWKGVYQDDDDENVAIKVKSEPQEDDDTMMMDVPVRQEESESVTLDEEDAASLSNSTQGSLSDLDETSETSSQTLPDDDIMQSENDHAEPGGNSETASPKPRNEWVERLLAVADQIDAINEALEDFEPDPSTSEPTPSTESHDLEPPTESALESDLFSNDQHPTFIFQLPPLLPSLHDSKKTAQNKKKPKPDKSPSIPKSTPASTNPFATDPIIKEDPDTNPCLDTVTSTNAIPHTYISGGFIHPAGHVGTLHTYKKGRMSAFWGGSSMEINNRVSGGGAATPQEMVLTRYESEVAKREDDGVKGEVWEEQVVLGTKGWGMGTVKEGFACVPEMGGLFC